MAHRPDRALRNPRIGACLLFPYVSACVFLVALAYAGGRWHAGWAPPLYWLAEIMLLGGVAYRTLAAGPTWNERASAVLMYSTAQSMVSWAYSPVQFLYPDELQHLRSLLNLLKFHHEFHVNYSLPISPDYPGLETVTAAVVQMTGLSPFVSGEIVVGVAHLLLTASLLLLYRDVTNSDRAAAMAALIYSLGTDQAIFRLFVYEALALPFLVLALHSSIEAAKHREWRFQRAPTALALAAVAMVAITHHVTAIAVVVLLAFLGGGLVAVRGGRPAGRRVLLISLVGAAIVASWIDLIARGTISYLGGPLADAANGGFAGHGSGAGAAPGTSPSALEHALSLSGPVLTIIFLPVGGWLLYKQGNRVAAVTRAWAVGGVFFFGVLVVRVVAADGTELAGRSLAYTALFSALVLAFVFELLLQGGATSGPSERGFIGSAAVHAIPRLAATAGILILGISGLLSAVPAAYQRLPGTFHVDGFQSGIDEENIAAAKWSTPNIGPGNKIFGDFTAFTLWSTLGNQQTIRGNVPLYRLYEAPTFRRKDVTPVSQLGVQYFEMDQRMAREAPVTGSYFAVPDNDQGHARRLPLPTSALSKFDRVRGISRIYDNGNIRLYDVRGSQYAP